MPKEEIKKLFESANSSLDQDHEIFVKAIQDDLQSFKKKIMEKI